MKELLQAKEFYERMDQGEREELWDALAENIFFLEEELQEKILELLETVDLQLCMEIRKRNSFTTE